MCAKLKLDALEVVRLVNGLEGLEVARRSSECRRACFVTGLAEIGKKPARVERAGETDDGQEEGQVGAYAQEGCCMVGRHAWRRRHVRWR